MSREWRLFLHDAISSCQRIMQYNHGLDRQAFEADDRTFDATIRHLELIGEAGRSRRGWPALSAGAGMLLTDTGRRRMIRT